MEDIGIYRIYCSSNDKTYIGQTTHLKLRLRQHRSRLKVGTHPNAGLQNAWRLYGAAAFLFEVVELCTADDVYLLERRHMGLYAPERLFNTGPAGPSPTIGVPKTQSHKERQSAAMGGRPFFSENLTTGEVRRHLLRSELSGDFSVNHIGACLRGTRPSHNGHRFYYDPASITQDNPLRPAKQKTKRAIVGTSQTTGERLRFDDLADVSSRGFHRGVVSQCLTGHLKHCGGFVWAYEDGGPPDAPARKQKTPTAARAVQSTHLVTGEVTVYTHAAAAAHALGLSSTALWKVLKGLSKSAANCTWRYL